MLENILPDKKTVKNIEINPENRKKIVTEVNWDVFKVFLGEHVKFLRQQGSWLNQGKSV